MGRPDLLCGLCPDSRVNRQFTVEECSSAKCRGQRFCRKHIAWYENKWLCKRCIRNIQKQRKADKMKAQQL